MAVVSIRPPSRASTSSLSPHALLLLLLVAALAVISRHSFFAAAAAGGADFEGFDSDDLADEFDVVDDDLILTSPPPPPTSLSSSSSSPPSESYQTPTTTTPSDPKPQPSPAAGAADLWDEDEFEGIPTAVDAPDSPDLSPATGEPLPAASLPSEPSEPPAPFSFRAYIVEIACVSFLICFLLNYFTGKRQNEAIALAWAAKFATRDSIFDKNFSLLGTGDGKDTPLLLKEGQEVFKFYASGRRYCQGMLATMELRCRHDLISRAFELLFPKKDTITFEVVLNDDAMDHVMLAIARKKLAKAMHKDERDLQRFATLGVSAPPGRKWVTDELTVISESKEVAGELITDAVIDQVFGEKAFEKFGKWFISLHFSDQSPGSHKKILMFKFVLPDANNMSDMTRLVTLVPYYIDLIGRYKLSPHAHSKTETARAKAAQEAYKELQNARQEAMQKKKAERKKLMEEAEAKLSAEVLRRKEEKDRARQLKKSMPKVKMLRSH